ncbi:hypothetical protein [Candidatus Nitrotoga sp. M5]|uniref:hypothetical protein n=1 Tax=Candidatus Nitrotoga sp. M5 TaxID=2890409 RepID=UPI001EF3244A|nr:hypothetical protein [Candidatus Nitrotoga sp. M5]CAH1385341.1 hypothetical protein NTGM5_110013 [Candidatus Nitrotoga sp. M5]
MKSYRLIPAILLGLLLSLGFLTGCVNHNEPIEDLSENAEEIGANVKESANDAQRGVEDATD